jgi:hypothetical protein
MGLDGNWLISRMRVKGSAMLQDRSVLSIALSGVSANVTYMKADNTFATLTATVNANKDGFSTDSNPYISGRLVNTAGCEFLTGWISDTKDASTRTQMDDFFAMRSSPLEGDWNIFSLSSTNTQVVSDNSLLTVLGDTVTFTKANGDRETIKNVDIGADSPVKERAQGDTGYRLDARLVRRGNFTFLVGTIGYGTDPGAISPGGDTNTDTFTAVKVSPGGMYHG